MPGGPLWLKYCRALSRIRAMVRIAKGLRDLHRLGDAASKQNHYPAIADIDKP
jgi:hypothetical protein